MTTDGENFYMETNELLFSANYYLSDDIVRHTIRAFNVTTLLANVGGLLALFLKIFTIVGKYINTQLFMNRLIGNFYYFKIENPRKSI